MHWNIGCFYGFASEWVNRFITEEISSNTIITTQVLYTELYTEYGFWPAENRRKF